MATLAIYTFANTPPQHPRLDMRRNLLPDAKLCATFDFRVICTTLSRLRDMLTTESDPATDCVVLVDEGMLGTENDRESFAQSLCDVLPANRIVYAEDFGSLVTLVYRLTECHSEHKGSS